MGWGWGGEPDRGARPARPGPPSPHPQTHSAERFPGRSLLPRFPRDRAPRQPPLPPGADGGEGAAPPEAALRPLLSSPGARLAAPPLFAPGSHAGHRGSSACYPFSCLGRLGSQDPLAPAPRSQPLPSRYSQTPCTTLLRLTWYPLSPGLSPPEAYQALKVASRTFQSVSLSPLTSSFPVPPPTQAGKQASLEVDFSFDCIVRLR